MKQRRNQAPASKVRAPSWRCLAISPSFPQKRGASPFSPLRPWHDSDTPQLASARQARISHPHNELLEAIPATEPYVRRCVSSIRSGEQLRMVTEAGIPFMANGSETAGFNWLNSEAWIVSGSEVFGVQVCVQVGSWRLFR